VLRAKRGGGEEKGKPKRDLGFLKFSIKARDIAQLELIIVTEFTFPFPKRVLSVIGIVDYIFMEILALSLHLSSPIEIPLLWNGGKGRQNTLGS
jgi:hypothetical protein